MFTPIPHTRKNCSCQGCQCNFTTVTLVESLLSPSAVPGGANVKSPATGTASLLLTNKNQFYVYLAVRNLQHITMAHIHLYNIKDPKTNGPVVLWLFHSMKQPVSFREEGTLVSQMFTTADFSTPYKNMSLEEFKKLVSDGKLYFNVHTVQNPNGELAGPVKIVHKINA